LTPGSEWRPRAHAAGTGFTRANRPGSAALPLGMAMDEFDRAEMMIAAMASMAYRC
jgi:hypothetical protein